MLDPEGDRCEGSQVTNVDNSTCIGSPLDDTGAFGDTRGGVFAAMVERNRKRWTREGIGVTMKVIMEGNKQYPDKDDD